MIQRSGLLFASVLVAVALFVTAGTALARGHRADTGGMRHRSQPHAMADVSSEADYLAHMIPHHEEAVTSARLLIEGTDRPEMRAFGNAIIDTQTAEIEQMKSWLAQWYPEHDTHVDYTPMMRDLTGLRGDELDRAFLEDMVPHHHMAVMMSLQLLDDDLVVHPEVEPFAANIRDVQMAEIHQMRGWMRDWFGSAPGKGHNGMGRMAGMAHMGHMGHMSH